jgi:hypothetical protein
MFLVNSRPGHFCATLLGFRSEFLHLARAHLLPKLRCQVAEFLNEVSLNALGFSPHPPVSVYSTDTNVTR